MNQQKQILVSAERAIVHLTGEEQRRRGQDGDPPPDMALAVWPEGPDGPPTVALGQTEVAAHIDPEAFRQGEADLAAAYIFRGLARTRTLLTTCNFAPWGEAWCGGDEERLVQFLDALAPAPPRPRPPRRTGPLPQPTAQEIRNAGIALADGPYREHWEALEGELALVHILPEAPLQAKLTGTVLPWWGLPEKQTHLWAVLQEAGIPAVLLLFETLGRLLELPETRSQVRVDLDELARAIGLNQRSSAARRESREKVYKLLLLLENLEVHGARNGVWKDPHTGAVLDLRSQDPLLRLTGKRMPLQSTLDDSGIPTEVAFTYGAWLEKFRGNRRILTDLGDLRRLAEIPTGKPSGALAQRIGLALNQKWREKAAHGDLRRVGEDPKHRTFPAWFTRQELCELYRGEPDLVAILEGHDPGRARQYWREAIKILKQQPAVIGYYKEIDTLPRIGSGITGWQDAWYAEQRLDIRPARETTEAIGEINAAAKKARAARSRKPKKPAAEDPRTAPHGGEETTQNCG